MCIRDRLNTLPLIEQHVAISNPELRELLIRHRHGKHIINVDSAIKDVLRSEIWALQSRCIYGQCLSGDDLAFLPNWRDIPLLRDDTELGLFVAGFYFHTAPIFLRCSSTRAASVATSSMSCGSGVA